MLVILLRYYGDMSQPYPYTNCYLEHCIVTFMYRFRFALFAYLEPSQKSAKTTIAEKLVGLPLFYG